MAYSLAGFSLQLVGLLLLDLWRGSHHGGSMWWSKLLISCWLGSREGGRGRDWHPMIPSQGTPPMT